MKKPTRRATYALGAAATGGLTTTMEQVLNVALSGEAVTTVWHTAAWLAFGVITYLMEAVRDAVKSRTGGALDLEDTVAAFRKATADGIIDATEGKGLAQAFTGDLEGAVEQLLDSEGADRVFAAIERYQQSHVLMDDDDPDEQRGDA